MLKLEEGTFPSWPIIGEEPDVVKSAVESGFWAGRRGLHLKSASDAFLKLQGGEYGIPLANGTVTLESALIALGIGEGDEVIVPACTFYSTVSAVLRVHAKPVVVDVNLSNFCISIDEVKKHVNAKTKAIVAVHLAGSMCDMDALIEICNESDLHLIEDCAHAHGSQWKGKGAGTIGDFGSFSFQHSKLISSGEGGFLIAKNKVLNELAWSYSNCGRDVLNSYYNHIALGTNNRMSELQAALLSCQLKRYEPQLNIREENAKFLAEALNEFDGVKCQTFDDRMTRNAHYVFIIYFEKAFEDSTLVSNIVQALKECNVPLSSPYPPLSELEVFKQAAFVDKVVSNSEKIVNAKKVYDSTVWLEHRVLLADKSALKTIVEVIKNELEKHGL